jgi:hypothetical protein
LLVVTTSSSLGFLHLASYLLLSEHGPILRVVCWYLAGTHILFCYLLCLRREATRDLYAPFESNMRYCSSDVYQHEMPGGQYTNLKFQAASLGLGDSWGKVQQSYAAANRALGDIVKVRQTYIWTLTIICMLCVDDQGCCGWGTSCMQVMGDLGSLWYHKTCCAACC